MFRHHSKLQEKALAWLLCGTCYLHLNCVMSLESNFTVHCTFYFILFFFNLQYINAAFFLRDQFSPVCC